MRAISGAILAVLMTAQGAATAGAAELTELRLPKGAGGIPFLHLTVMEKHKSVEKHAERLGHKDLKVSYVSLGGAAVTIDALLSGATHVHIAGPPSFLFLWDRTRGAAEVTGIAAMSSIPAYLNTTDPNIKSLKDVTEKDKIALNAVKVSIPSIIMQMYARKEYGPAETFRFDKFTVAMTHPDGVIALLTGGSVNMHFTSVSFHAREIKDPRVRTLMSTDDVMGGSTTFTMMSAPKKLREESPITYKALLAGLKDAVDFINTDRKGAAQIYFDSIGGKGETMDEIIASLADPKNVMTMTPQNTLKYAEFMHDIGSLKNRPKSWKDLFFQDIHDLPGS